MQFDHTGIATDDSEGLTELFGELCDLPVAHEESFEGMKVIFLDSGAGYFELLEPEDGGAIADYLNEYGPGIHHLALATEDIEDALDRAKELGIERINEGPRPGAWGHDVAFLHPKSTGGILIEFVEH